MSREEQGKQDKQGQQSEYVYIIQEKPRGECGHLTPVGFYLDEDEAVDSMKHIDVTNTEGYWVIRYPIGDWKSDWERVYGYRRDWNGKWGYGWTDLRDAPTDDPEWGEYQRLVEKFKGQ